LELTDATQYRQQHNAVLGKKNLWVQITSSAMGIWEANSARSGVIPLQAMKFYSQGNWQKHQSWAGVVDPLSDGG